MSAYRFATTQLKGLHAAGRAADLQHGLISALLARHLGPDYRDLFADFEVRDSDTRDWFVEGPPAPVQVIRLPEHDQAAIRARAAERIAAVAGLADRIERQGAEGRNVARVLRDATVYPPEDLWLYRDAPLIVNWGYSREEAPVRGPVAISAPVRLDPRPGRAAPAETRPALPVLQAAASAGGSRAPRIAATLLWLLLALTIGRIYADLLPACGLKWPFAIGDCPTVVAPDPIWREATRLQRAVEEAELAVAEEAQTCAPRLRPPAEPK